MSDAPPEPLSGLESVKTCTLPRGTTLYRIHDGKYHANAFNPCKGQPTRFAPIFDTNGKCIPSLYAAETFVAAAYETVFHDIPLSTSHLPSSIEYRKISHYNDAKIELKKELVLVELFTVPLRKHGVSRMQLIESSAAHYQQTAKWAKAFHDQVSKAQGLVWKSRKDDRAKAYLFFGDRVKSADFIVRSRRTMMPNSTLEEALQDAARQGGIRIRF